MIRNDAIPFKKWQTTDKNNFELDFYDFLDEICDQIRKLTVYHFIAESQNKLFKYAKANLFEGVSQFSILQRITLSLYKMQFRVFIGTALRQLFIHFSFTMLTLKKAVKIV